MVCLLCCAIVLFLYISAIFRETNRKVFFNKPLYKKIISTFITRKTIYNGAHANLRERNKAKYRQ